MKVILAKTAGFCFGVNRAINMVEEALNQNMGRVIYSLGRIIHNKQVIEKFEQRGVTIVEDIEEVPDKSLLVIRAHGISPEIYDGILEKKLEIIDTTCPFVKKIHKKVAECINTGKKVVIVGDKNHPEVIGIKGWNKNAIIIDSEEEAQKLEFDGEICIVAQTTLSNEKWESINTTIKDKVKDCEVCNTICSATYERQKEAKEIAEKADLMIIVGDPGSSNSRKLYEISKKYCNNAIFIENANQLDISALSTQHSALGFKVGITAGASTPDRIIKEVVNKMSQMNDTTEEMSFAELFEQSMKTVKQDEITRGKIISITDKEVFVDLGYKADGIISMDEFSDDPEEKPANLYKVGDEIDVYVVNVNDGEGNVLLSRKRIEHIKGWNKLEEAFEKGTFLKGVISDVVNGGVIAPICGVRVFIPASLLSDRRIENLNDFRKKPVTLKIVDFNRYKKKAVGSQKAFLVLEKEKTKKDMWEKIEIGQVVQGVASRVTNFGVFVDIGGIDGLIHISELSWNRIKHPSEVVKEGQQLEVRIIDIDKEKDRISLGYRKTMDDPWQSILDNKVEVGQVVKSKVVSMMPFGAFVEIQPGLTGLVHISQISDKRIAKPQDVLKIGQEVEAKITEIDKEKKKISLSIKETLPAFADESVGVTEGQELISNEHNEEMNVTVGDLLKQEE